MKKMILIAASFLLNATYVKYDCFAMNKHADMVSEYMSLDSLNGSDEQRYENCCMEKDEETRKVLFSKVSYDPRYRSKKEQSEDIVSGEYLSFEEENMEGLQQSEKLGIKLSNCILDEFVKNPGLVLENLSKFGLEVTDKSCAERTVRKIISEIKDDIFKSYETVLLDYVTALCAVSAYKEDNEELAAIKSQTDKQIKDLSFKNLWLNQLRKFEKQQKEKMAERVNELEEDNKNLRHDNEQLMEWYSYFALKMSCYEV